MLCRHKIHLIQECSPCTGVLLEKRNPLNGDTITDLEWKLLKMFETNSLSTGILVSKEIVSILDEFYVIKL